MEHALEADSASPGLARMALVQGGFDVVTGVWPILHLRSFEWVTGPKPEGWLVKTVGALISVIGGTLLSAGLRRRVSPEVRLLGMGSAAAFIAVDLIYVAKRRISPVYLLDAVAEVALLAGWAWARLPAHPKSFQPALIKGPMPSLESSPSVGDNTPTVVGGNQ